MTENVFLPDGVEVKYNVKVPMRDGVDLSVDIYSPRGKKGPFPVIFSRTPYNNVGESIESYIFFAQHGYVWVAQDVRGCADSDGVFYPWVNEYNDGYDTIEWIGSQTWCDGNVGMAGGSYVGNVQWQAATMGSRYLKAIVPTVSGNNLHESARYVGGAFQLGLNTTWSFIIDGGTWPQPVDLYNWEQLFQTLPLKDIPKVGGKNIPHYQDWLAHPDYDDYWKALAIDEQYEKIKIPVLQIGGYYDLFAEGVLNNFVGMRARGGSELARNNQRVIMGPWIHGTSLTHAGEVDFGMESTLDPKEVELQWFDRWLKNIPNGADKEAPVRIFIMGINEWRDENEWPLARTQYTPYYFHSEGSANSLLGDGKLTTDTPSDEPSDEFVYNPAFPVPTSGGCTCCNPEIVPWGAYDQRSIEYRNDVLVYTSEPLEEDLEVTGHVMVKLYASTDGTDTDFTGKLVDVRPDGYAMNLCDGIIRGRYRESTSCQKLLKAGDIYEFSINLWTTGNVFLKGHRIRVEISSSNFPRFDRNPNTGNKFAEDTELRTANQIIFHNEKHPSHIILPVIPRK